jgi:hypothetical protein
MDFPCSASKASVAKQLHDQLQPPCPVIHQDPSITGMDLIEIRREKPFFLAITYY